MATATPEAPFSRWRTVGLMTGLMLAVLLALMDQTVVSTALPTVVSDLGGLGLYAWVFSAYLLAQTSFLPIFGKLSDLYGRRLFFLMGLGFFMGGSILCGQAQNMQQLILFRGLQGVGGAGLMPVALAILGYNYGPRERSRLQGILGSAAGLAVMIGPTVGSFIVEHLSWRWIFYVNLPFGVLSALFIIIFLKESREKRVDPAVDYVGALTLIGWVVSLMLAFFYSGGYGWTSPQILALLSVFAVLLVVFLRNEVDAEEPVLPLRIFANRTVAAAGAVTMIRAVAMYSLIIFVPLLVQGVLGGTAVDARNALTIYALPGILGAVAAGFLVARNIGYRTLIASGLASFAVGLWLVGQIGVGGSEGELLRGLVIAGIGIGLTQVTIILVIQNSVARQFMGTASSLAQFLTNLAGTVGVGLISTYQSGLLEDGVTDVLSSPAFKQLPPNVIQALSDTSKLGRVLISPALASRLPVQLLEALRTAVANSLQSVFEVGLALAAIALIVSLFMRGSVAGRNTESKEANHPELKTSE